VCVCNCDNDVHQDDDDVVRSLDDDMMWKYVRNYENGV